MTRKERMCPRCKWYFVEVETEECLQEEDMNSTTECKYFDEE